MKYLETELENLVGRIVLEEELQMTPRSVVWVIDVWYCQVFRERKEKQV